MVSRDMLYCAKGLEENLTSVLHVNTCMCVWDMIKCDTQLSARITKQLRVSALKLDAFNVSFFFVFSLSSLALLHTHTQSDLSSQQAPSSQFLWPLCLFKSGLQFQMLLLWWWHMPPSSDTNPRTTKDISVLSRKFAKTPTKMLFHRLLIVVLISESILKLTVT